MDLNLLYSVILVSVVTGLLCGTLLMLVYRGTPTLSYTLKERISIFFLACLLTTIFFGFYAVISGPSHYLYYVVAIFGVCIPVALMLLPNWFGVYSKRRSD